MKKYKICPVCQSKNDPALLECSVCETDLTGVRITDEETEQITEENRLSDNVPESGKAVLVRICDCGERNPANARKCRACHEDISDIIPVPDSVSAVSRAAANWALSTLDGQYIFKIESGETIIGRENELHDYLASKSYVSRVHAKFTLDYTGLYIENLSKTNFTYINNKMVYGKTRLEEGDELGLGGKNINGNRQSQAAYFLVRMEPCI